MFQASRYSGESKLPVIEHRTAIVKSSYALPKDTAENIKNFPVCQLFFRADYQTVWVIVLGVIFVS